MVNVNNKQMNAKKWIIISVAVMAFIVIVVLVYFLGIRKPSVSGPSFTFFPIYRLALSGQEVKPMLTTGLTLDPSRSEYFYNRYPNASVGLISRHSSSYYFNGSSSGQYGIVKSDVYMYASPLAANSSFNRNKQNLIGNGCSALTESSANDTNVFICSLSGNYNGTITNLDVVLMSRSDLVGWTSVTETGMPNANPLNETLSYAKIVASKMDYEVNLFQTDNSSS